MKKKCLITEKISYPSQMRNSVGFYVLYRDQKLLDLDKKYLFQVWEYQSDEGD